MGLLADVLKSDLYRVMGFPGGAVVKNLPDSARDARTGSVPGSGRAPGVGNGNSPQYSCLENPMDRGMVGYSSRGCKESDLTEHARWVLAVTCGI